MRKPFGKLVRRYWVFAALVIGGIAFGVWRVAELPAFWPSAIEVTELAHVPRATIVTRAAISPHANVWLLNRRAIAARIESIPYVASARVGVRPPAIVTLSVTERTVDGCVRDGAAHAYTIDAALRVLALGCTGSEPVAYVMQTALFARAGAYLRERELTSLVADARTLDAPPGTYRALGYDAFGELQATLRSGIVVKFGTNVNLDRKQRLVGPILAEVETQGRRVRVVDVRAERTPVVEFRPAAPAHPHAVDKL